jgi:hypothetical protein
MNGRVKQIGFGTTMLGAIAAMLSVAGEARANAGTRGYIYSVTIGWQQIDPQTKQITKTGTYGRYFVTVYENNQVDYGGADRAWYEIMRYQNCHPRVEHYSFFRATTGQ